MMGIEPNRARRKQLQIDHAREINFEPFATGVGIAAETGLKNICNVTLLFGQKKTCHQRWLQQSSLVAGTRAGSGSIQLEKRTTDTAVLRTQSLSNACVVKYKNNRVMTEHST